MEIAGPMFLRILQVFGLAGHRGACLVFPSFRDQLAAGSQGLGFVNSWGLVFGIFQVFDIVGLGVSNFSGLQFSGIGGRVIGFVGLSG